MMRTVSVATLALMAWAMSPPARADDAPFTYTIPPKALAIAPLAAKLRADAAKQRRDFDAEVASVRKDDPEMASRFTLSREWKVVTDIPRFLSLSLDGYDYTGGAHGNPFSDGMIWDRVRGQALKPVDMFVSAAALRRAINAAWCAGLTKQRVEKRGGDGRLGTIPEFDGCIDPTQQVLLLGSRRSDRFDRIGIIANVYQAGPYSEGSYEVTVPVTPAIIAAVKPEYRPFFVSGR